jgi:REP element-mobilizing transposase RayT
MVFTVEPMLNEGTYELKVLADRWTVITKDKKLSAQFEHTVAVTEEGVEILTLASIFFWKRGYGFVSAGGAPLEILKKYIENQGYAD